MNNEFQHPRALIADSDEEFRIVLRKILEESGAEVEVAANGKQVLILFEGVQPDIVFMQTTLPELDGFSTCEEIRKLPNGKSTPIILLAEMDDGVTAPVADAVGATECIVKPLDWFILSCRIILALRTYCTSKEDQARFANEKLLRKSVLSSGSEIDDGELMDIIKRLKNEMGHDVLTGLLRTMLESVEKAAT